MYMHFHLIFIVFYVIVLINVYMVHIEDCFSPVCGHIR